MSNTGPQGAPGSSQGAPGSSEGAPGSSQRAPESSQRAPGSSQSVPESSHGTHGSWATIPVRTRWPEGSSQGRSMNSLGTSMSSREQALSSFGPPIGFPAPTPGSQGPPPGFQAPPPGFQEPAPLPDFPAPIRFQDHPPHNPFAPGGAYGPAEMRVFGSQAGDMVDLLARHQIQDVMRRAQARVVRVQDQANEAQARVEQAQAEAEEALAQVAQAQAQVEQARQDRLRWESRHDRLQQTLVATIHREMKASFASSRLWEFERSLGNGSFGATMLLKDKDPLNRRGHRRVVLKRVIQEQLGNQDFAAEIGALKAMRGNAHHVQILGATDDVAEFAPTYRSRFNRAVKRFVGAFKVGLFSNPTSNVFRAMSVTRGPAMLLEFVENGDLIRFQMRADALGIILPNRLLWSFYLCFVRAVIGLAYPRDGPPDAPQETEEIGVNGRPRGITHNDIATRNIVVGESEGVLSEHFPAPKLKLIDFGMAREGNDVDYAITRNTTMISGVMLALIKGSPDVVWNGAHPVLHNGNWTYAVDMLPPLNQRGNSTANLDPDLRDLLADVMAANEAQRPSLAQLLRRVQEGAAKPAAAYLDRWLEESDHTIERILNQIINDA
ncbi:hypothetical protein GGS24DRAFT_476506 [Hypoxylon argillaceum]|nr:hypothetical protein GGS24DRAFT_476506 [Hypoxylon argillaceum]